MLLQVLPGGGIFIPHELVSGVVNAVIMLGILFLGCFLVWGLGKWLGTWLKRLIALRRMSKVERAREYLLEHDPQYQRMVMAHETTHTMLERIRAGMPRRTAAAQTDPQRKVFWRVGPRGSK